MSFAVTQACLGCKDTACVAVCPMSCFLEGPDLLVIDPDECIDCAICVPECPVDAIRADAELTADQRRFVDASVQRARDSGWQPLLTPLPSAA